VDASQCRMVWGNRYMSADMEEMLLEELRREGLLQKAWSRGSRTSQVYTPGGKGMIPGRRIAWKVTAFREGRYLSLVGQEEADTLTTRLEDTDVDTATPRSLPKWLDVPALSEEMQQHRASFVAVDWANTPLGPLEQWSQSLVCMVNVCLSCPFPMLLSWGPEMILL
jgi:hypothetical protein